MNQRLDGVERLACLNDATRRSLYEFVVAQREPVTRDAAGDALDVDRSVAAYHLDKLVEQGLLAASFARPEGRSGPGAGRPAKHYERAEGEVSVSVPPRDYRLAAELLARAAEADGGDAVRDALHEAARDFGHELADDGASRRADLVAVLEEHGFEPFDDDGVIRLRNCPFHQLARRHTDLVCGMNVALMQGLAGALEPSLEARLDPAPGRCCVSFTR